MRNFFAKIFFRDEFVIVREKMFDFVSLTCPIFCGNLSEYD